MTIRLPDNTKRILILGKTGSGKTCAGVWHLAQRNLNRECWIVINHKCDDLIDGLPGAKFLEMNERPPRRAKGVYIYHPVPDMDDEAVNQLLWWVHAHRNIGVYVDEGYMIPNRDPAFQALLTQGRSLKVPMIILSQRPVWLTRFAISESDFFQVFRLSDARDRKTIQGFIPVDLESLMSAGINQDVALPDYHSIYYDVGRNRAVLMTPVPTGDAIYSLVDSKIDRLRIKKM